MFRKTLAALTLVAVVAALGILPGVVENAAQAQLVTPPPVRYAAIAYSPATRRYGYSYNWETLADAQREAIRHCEAYDARPVVYAYSGWYCALAVGTDGSYGYGSGPTAAHAEAVALHECRKHTYDCRIVACVRSGG